MLPSLISHLDTTIREGLSFLEVRKFWDQTQGLRNRTVTWPCSFLKEFVIAKSARDQTLSYRLETFLTPLN